MARQPTRPAESESLDPEAAERSSSSIQTLMLVQVRRERGKRTWDVKLTLGRVRTTRLCLLAVGLELGPDLSLSLGPGPKASDLGFRHTAEETVTGLLLTLQHSVLNRVAGSKAPVGGALRTGAPATAAAARQAFACLFCPIVVGGHFGCCCGCEEIVGGGNLV